MAEQQENHHQQQQQQDRHDEELVLVDDKIKIGLNNYKIALEKSQPDVIYKVCLAILKQYYFFNAFNAIIFEVNADLLCDALRITPKVSDHPFTQPPLEEEIIAFIIQLRYSGSLTKGRLQEDFKFQIESKKISKQKKELLPFPRFTKLIIKHILSQNNHISKRIQSYHHVIKIDASLRNLKFTNKGARDPVFGMPIPVVMLSEEIKAYEDYLNYLAKSTGTQPIKFKGKGKGLLTKKGVEVVVETVRILKKRRLKTGIKETGQSEEVADTVDSKETEDDKEEYQLTRRR
ncbi:hypothetical protein Tco_0309408 [Tanacetum coccineum]